MWILLSGALVRIGLWYAWTASSPLINDDARDFQHLAISLATSGGYANEHGKLISLRPPLYPAAVAGVYRCVGMKNDDAVRALQAAISLLTVVLVYLLAVMVYTPRVGVWAAGICCFYPSLLVYTNLLLSETLFTFFAVAFTWLVVKSVRQQSLLLLAHAGAVMGLAALTRSIMLLFLPVLVVFVVFVWHGGWNWRAWAAMVPALSFALVVGGWAVRNTQVQQTLTFIDVMGGRNLMMGNYEHTPLERSWATISDVPPEQAWNRVLERKYRFQSPLTQGKLDKLALRYAIDFIWRHPGLTIKRDVVKFFNFWQLERELPAAAKAGYFGDISASTQMLMAAVICGSYVVVLFAAVFGVCCVPPHDLRVHLLLLASIMFPCMIHALIFAHSRYHLPIIPLLSLYAAAAIVHFREIWQRRRSWSCGLAAGICAIVALSWIRELMLVDHEFLEYVLR